MNAAIDTDNSTAVSVEAAKKWTMVSTPEQKKSGLYSADDVINAYLAGKKKGFDEHKQILLEKFSSNLSIAQAKGSELFEFLSSMNIKIFHLFLKPSSITNFSILCVVGQDDFLSEKISEAYEKTIEEKKKVRSGTFGMEFSFMPDGNINSKKIASDGYIFKYGKK